MTIKQCIKAIKENESSIFDFEGFDNKKDEDLKNHLLFLIRQKYGSPNLSDSKRVKKAGKNTNELKAMGLYWHSKKVSWYYKPSWYVKKGTSQWDMEKIRNTFGSQVIKNENTNSKNDFVLA